MGEEVEGKVHRKQVAQEAEQEQELVVEGARICRECHFQVKY